MRLTPDEFRSWDLFATFAHTAWRMESRDAYSVAVEAEPFRMWLAGEVPDLEYRSPWLGTVRAAVAQSKRIERVRIVPDPLTDYLRFEAWLGKQNTDAGEDIRYLARSCARELGVPHHNTDCWLFDSHRLFQMHFDDADQLVGVELVEDHQEIVLANRYRDAVWHYATPFRDWYTEHQHECEPEQRQARA